MLLQNGDTLLMIGDSITDCERKRPMGTGLHGALGTGYVSLLSAMLDTRQAEIECRVINMGISGNTSYDLLARWEEDVTRLQPQVVTVMIGINDVWHAFNRPHDRAAHVSENEYRANLREIARRTRPAVRTLVFVSPYYIESNREEPMRRQMDRFRLVMREEARRSGAAYIDIQDVFDRYVPIHYHPSFFAWDRVHPNLSGHMIIAEEIYAGLCGAKGLSD